jgi:SAM-dependent methyltransferase
VPYAELYVGVDPIPGLMPDVQLDSDPRLCLVRAAAESLPFPNASFDLVIAAMSFAYWKDQRKGIGELARVVARNGKVVLVESTGGDAKGKGRLHGDKDIAYALERAGLELEHTETVGRSRMGKAQARAFIAIP